MSIINGFEYKNVIIRELLDKLDDYLDVGDDSEYQCILNEPVILRMLYNKSGASNVSIDIKKFRITHNVGRMVIEFIHPIILDEY